MTGGGSSWFAVLTVDERTVGFIVAQRAKNTNSEGCPVPTLPHVATDATCQIQDALRKYPGANSMVRGVN
jgi:hypothetical protein